MRLAHYSLFVLILLNLFAKDVHGIRGCTVRLKDTQSLYKHVLCDYPSSPILSIPSPLPDKTEQLIIMNQNIKYINEHDLDNTVELSILRLTSSNLERIHQYAFRKLSDLSILDLSSNRLTISEHSLPKELMHSLSGLKYLILTNNPLMSIPDAFFKPLSSLVKLAINDCGLSTLKISDRAFQGLNLIEIIDMRNSSIERLNRAMEIDFRNMTSLRVLLVGDNPWICDCELRWFYLYLTSLQDMIAVKNDETKSPRCYKPKRLENSIIPALDDKKRLKPTDFVCPAKCSALSPENQIIKSDNTLNLTCQCFSDPVKPVVWTKNGHKVEEALNKFRIFQSGKEIFNSTLQILSLQSVDSGNWSCKLEDVEKNFTIKIHLSSEFPIVASLNVYIFVGLGSSLLLISLIIVMMVMFCKRDSLCQYRSQNPMVICGYETQIRKPSAFDGDIQFTYNQQDGRFHSSFYENAMPVNSNFSLYQRINPNYDDSLSEKIRMKDNDQKQKLLINTKNINNDKMLNIYCGCHNYSIFNSDDEPNFDPLSESFTSNSKSMKRLLESQRQNSNNNNNNNNNDNDCNNINKINNSSARNLKIDRHFQTLPLKSSAEVEKLIPKIRQCPFHGSSATLTRVPGDKPCPVHGSTATLPSRLSSKRIEHRSGCPKHDKDNISVKSLKMENSNTNKIQPHRSKSVNKISSFPEKVEIVTPVGYRPCPLHGDILEAITENLTEPMPNTHKSHKKQQSHTKMSHSKPVFESSNVKFPPKECDKVNRKSIEPTKHPCDYFPVTSSGNISNNLTSPVQSSLSSSPLLTSDVHGTLV